MRFASFRCPTIFLGLMAGPSAFRVGRRLKASIQSKNSQALCCHLLGSSNQDSRILKPGKDAFGGFVDGATGPEPLYHRRKAHSNMLQSFGLVEKRDHFGMKSFRSEVALEQLGNNFPAGNQVDQAVKGNPHQILANDPG